MTESLLRLIEPLLLVPPAAPAAPAAPAVSTAPDGSVTLTLIGLPATHPAADTPYSLEIYRGAPGSASERRAVLPVLDPGLAWTPPLSRRTPATTWSSSTRSGGAARQPAPDRHHEFVRIVLYSDQDRPF